MSDSLLDFCFLVLFFSILQSTLNNQLLQAVRDGNCDGIRRLVEEGADKNCKDWVREKSSFSFLSISVYCIHYCVFEYLNFTLCSYRVVILH